LTTLLAITLTIGEALVVAKAARVATTTNAKASIRKIRSIIPPTTWLRTAASVALITSDEVKGQTERAKQLGPS
jgi:hypothetical protein